MKRLAPWIGSALLLPAGLALMLPSSARGLTFGELRHQGKAGSATDIFVGPNEDFQVSDGGFSVTASVLLSSTSRLEVSYTVFRSSFLSIGESLFRSFRIPFALAPGEPLRLRGNTFLDVAPLDVNLGGSARWILVDQATNRGTLLHIAPNGSDSFDLSFSVGPGDWALIYEGRAAPGTVGSNPTGQPPAIVSADFVIFTPEPATGLLLAAGLVLLAARRGEGRSAAAGRRRRSSGCRTARREPPTTFAG